jgi:hypothetical protein
MMLAIADLKNSYIYRLDKAVHVNEAILISLSQRFPRKQRHQLAGWNSSEKPRLEEGR